MESVATLLKVTLPRYLEALPFPETVGGFFKLSGFQLLQLLPAMLTIGYLLYSVVRLFHPVIESVRGNTPKGNPINPSINKDSPKVVNLVDVEDITSEKVAYCRCWKSSKFPLCDGSHNEHNKDTGDNVGPLVIKKKIK